MKCIKTFLIEICASLRDLSHYTRKPECPRRKALGKFSNFSNSRKLIGKEVEEELKWQDPRSIKITMLRCQHSK